MNDLKKLIKEYIKEYVSQHNEFNYSDLNDIGKVLSNNLSKIGFIIRKSNVSFNNVFCFDTEKLGKVYQIFIKKKFHSINEDMQTFNRNDPELSAFLKQMGNKNLSLKSSQKEKPNQTFKTTKNYKLDDDESDDTIMSSDNNLYKRNFEYCIEFQDKSKNNDIIIQHKKIFNGNKEEFKNFIEQFVYELMKNFATK
jgi:hypothetical protein